MKKIIACLMLSALVLTGCSIGEDMDNTPTKKVEEYLNNYQTLDSNVLAELDSIVNSEEMFDEDQKVTYRDILKNYKGLQNNCDILVNPSPTVEWRVLSKDLIMLTELIDEKTRDTDGIGIDFY